MKVSLNWIRYYNDLYKMSADPAPDGVETLVEKIGAQLGAVEEVIDIGSKYQGILVVKVVSCVKHPNADKLSLCLIDDGGATKEVKRNSEGLVQVVCGAPNVKAGLLAAWIPPSATVPSTANKDPFVIEAREIRGQMSNGMLASLKELDLGDNHDGILEVDEKVKPGMQFAKVYELDDYIIDIENKMFTHRPDLFGQLGIARELAGIAGNNFKSPDWYKEDAKLPTDGRKNVLKLQIKNELPKLVPRFCAVAVADVKVAPSPVWLQTYLSRVGVRPINNLVDLSNYYMLLTAQPIHMYDYDKIKNLAGTSGAELTIRYPKSNEIITVLGGKTIKPGPKDMMVAAGKHLVCVGGIIGGSNSEVDENTKNIIIEAANWDMNTIRKTSMTHGLFTDAATRFTKNQSPRQNTAVIAKILEDVQRLAGGRQASPLVDDKHFSEKPESVHVSAEFINSRLGLKLSLPEITKLLTNVEFVVKASGDKLVITAPFWRTDIEIPEDIVEEVGRLYGYDHLPVVLPTKDLTPAAKNPELTFKSRIRDVLSAAGANELLTYSFVHGDLLQKAGQDAKKSYQLKNALSPDLHYYRQSLTPSLLDKVHSNIKLGFDRFALFELGKTHVKGKLDDEKLPKEFEQLSLVIADQTAGGNSPFFIAKTYLEHLLNELGIQNATYEPLNPGDNDAATVYYEPGRAATIKAAGQTIGRIGEYKQSVKQSFKLPKICAGFELGLEPLEQLASSAVSYSPLNRFPSLDQDICLRSESKLSYAQLTEFIDDQLLKVAKEHDYNFKLDPLDIFQKPGDTNHKQTTWRITLAHPERTLTTAEANKVLDIIAHEAKQKLKAERI